MYRRVGVRVLTFIILRLFVYYYYYYSFDFPPASTRVRSRRAVNRSFLRSLYHALFSAFRAFIVRVISFSPIGM